MNDKVALCENWPVRHIKRGITGSNLTMLLWIVIGFSLCGAIALLVGLAAGARSRGDGNPPWHAAQLPPLLAPSIGISPELPETPSYASPCGLCEKNDLPLGLHLTAATVDSIGEAFSIHNLDVIEKAEDLLRAGGFGPPGNKDARCKARTFFQLGSCNGFHYLTDLSTKRDHAVWGYGDGTVAPFREKYLNAAVYPLRFIHKVRLGANCFCLEYEIPETYDEHIQTGDLRLRVRRVDVKLPHRGKTPVLSREFPNSDGKRLELLFEQKICGRVSRDRIVDRGDTLDIIALHDLQGMHVRKWGVHKLGALVMWVTLVEGNVIPKHPRLGACAYFPDIKFRLPSVLPDIGLSDLRDFSFPLPLMLESWYRQPSKDLPSWLRIQAGVRIRDWKSIGPRPRILDKRFPDL